MICIFNSTVCLYIHHIYIYTCIYILYTIYIYIWYEYIYIYIFIHTIYSIYLLCIHIIICNLIQRSGFNIFQVSTSKKRSGPSNLNQGQRASLCRWGQLNCCSTLLLRWVNFEVMIWLGHRCHRRHRHGHRRRHTVNILSTSILSVDNIPSTVWECLPNCKKNHWTLLPDTALSKGASIGAAMSNGWRQLVSDISDRWAQWSHFLYDVELVELNASVFASTTATGAPWHPKWQRKAAGSGETAVF